MKDWARKNPRGADDPIAKREKEQKRAMFAEFGGTRGKRQEVMSGMAKIAAGDFANVQFKYKYPLIFLDLIDALTGETILKKLRAYEYPHQY